jgi:putative membrane protein
MTPRPAAWVRDHLANERTLLAWVRTALTFMAFGIAVAKFGLLLDAFTVDHPELRDVVPSSTRSHMLGSVLVAFGGGLALVGLVKTRRWAQRIAPGHEIPSQRTLTAVAALLVGLAVVLLVYLFV